MPFLGAHMSIAGGLYTAFDRIARVRGKSLQIFLRNQRQWNAPFPDGEAIERFGEAWRKSGRIPVAAHDSYLINLAASDPVTAEKSVAAFSDELRLCRRLGIKYLITHPGAHRGDGLAPGIERFVRNLDRAYANSAASSVSVLIETTAGQGSGIGSTFEEIARILNESQNGPQMGVCLDTCHIFAAGYDIRDKESYDAVFARFDRTIGLDRLRFFHLNDSKKGLGSRVDRHEHIGKGEIGLGAFRLLLNDPRFQSHPMVLETPKGEDLREDRRNLRILRSLPAKQR